MLSAFLCCQAFGGAFGFDHVTIHEAALRRAIHADLKDQGRANVRALGGYSPAAFPVYLRWLNQDPPDPELDVARVLLMVRQAEGDRSAFRPHAVRLLAHEQQSVSRNALDLLARIGTADDAAAVAALLDGPARDVSYYTSVVETLAAIGTEKEIVALEVARKAGLKRDYPDFWARVDKCETAIRERAAKAKDPKATPPDKK
jgi:hypothetical protein